MFFVFFKQKTAYEMRISDWSSDVCSSDLRLNLLFEDLAQRGVTAGLEVVLVRPRLVEVQRRIDDVVLRRRRADRAVALRVVRVTAHYFNPSSSSSTLDRKSTRLNSSH